MEWQELAYHLAIIFTWPSNHEEWCARTCVCVPEPAHACMYATIYYRFDGTCWQLTETECRYEICQTVHSAIIKHLWNAQHKNLIIWPNPMYLVFISVTFSS